ncbi:MAG: hypothetical protein JKY53_12875 [Flavobacteriales bacterium]|nr:hypothetical protein [Flavobacteriales bacterium]
MTQRSITVSYPEHASNVKISAYMKNEPWGGHTGKPNTDDLGSTDYRPCGLGVGECSISWSKVSTTTTSSVDQNGYVTVRAIFYNWAHRNDRTGKLEVTYSLDDDK